MSNFFLIRNKCGIDCESFYEEKTDVWFLGDVRGYKSFLNRLRSAITSKHNLHLWPLAKNECNMLLSVLPPAALKSKRPQMKFWERPVFFRSKPWMELVVSGNISGYKLFISQLELFLKEPANDSSSHLHFDDQNGYQPWIKQRSVSLNLRGPLKKWSLEKIRENGHETFLKRKLPDTIPADISYYFSKTTRAKYHEISQAETKNVWSHF